jgi:hypothetical protein
MRFRLEPNNRGMTDQELLDDLRASAKRLGRATITMAEYGTVSAIHVSTLQRRFGSWVKALELAGLQPSRSKIGITNDELFENLRSLWVSLGRQPKYDDVKAPDSRYSAGTYENRFGSWSNALRDFVEWANSDSPEGAEPETSDSSEHPTERDERTRRRTRREITDRQRFRILVRDGFRCMSCGASPLKQPGIELHVDHILPWSKGGETTDENLHCKCKQCNLGKGNAFDA